MPKLHVTARVWCGTEVRHKRVEPIFSATPPLETLRVLLCVACQEDVFRVEDPLFDSHRGRELYTHAARDVYVRLPDEDPMAKQPGVCGKLRNTTHGSLDAAKQWGEHYAQVLDTGGLAKRRGISVPFFHTDLEIYILVHGNDCSKWADRRGESMH